MSHKGGAIADTDYGYDLVGHQTSATFTASGQGITNTYNGYNEILSTTSNMGGTARTLSYLYDGDSDRIRIIEPDGASFSYTFDGMDRMNGLYEGAGTTVPLQTFTYRTDGLLSSRSETGGSSISYGWDPMSRLQSQSDAFVGSGDVTWTLGYNPASQITSDARSNSSYSWTGAVTVNRGYAVNGLNQYTGAGSANFTYDPNGNLTGDGTWVYTYDGENHLIHATGSGKDVTLSYDPLGRLWSVGGSNIADVNFLYDGDALVGEYSSSNGNIANRYVHGSNAAADDPLVRYIGSAVGSSNRRYFHADHEGSIVAQSDGTGTNVAINTYDEYGIPGSGNDSRFGYTGQAYFYEIGLDYYKARMYSPTLGRFLQTDPIGYDGGENLYAYVKDDPVDKVDSSGLKCDNQGCTSDVLPNTTVDVTYTPQEASAAQAGIAHFQFATPDNEEPTGAIREVNANLVAVPIASKGDQVGDAATAAFTLGANDKAGIHGHLDGSMVDVPTANKGYGDTQSLASGKPMFTVEGRRIGVHDAPGGQLRFKMIAGTLRKDEQKAIQDNLNSEQMLYNQLHPKAPKDPCHTGAQTAAVDTCSG